MPPYFESSLIIFVLVISLLDYQLTTTRLFPLIMVIDL